VCVAKCSTCSTMFHVKWASWNTGKVLGYRIIGKCSMCSSTFWLTKLKNNEQRSTFSLTQVLFLLEHWNISVLAHVERAWLQLKLCSTYLFHKVIFTWNMWNIFSPWCKHRPHHFVMIVVGHTLNDAFNKKSRRLASTFAFKGGPGGYPPVRCECLIKLW